MAERLTIRAEEDGIKAVWYGDRDVFLEGEVGYAEADKLAHYEDLEEHGRLIELPCAVGDTVWFIGRKCVTCNEDDCYGCPHNRNGERKNEKFLYITTIKQFEITKNAVYMIDTDTVWSSTENSFNIDEIGRTVFLTKEEAEAKLKERGEQE